MIRTSGLARLLLVLQFHHPAQASTRQIFSSFVGQHRVRAFGTAAATWNNCCDHPSLAVRRSTGASLLWLPLFYPPKNVVLRGMATSPSSPLGTTSSENGTAALATAQRALERLARRGKSWKRLRHLVELALEDSSAPTTASIADVGTDHGLLAMALAVSGKFERVYGVDVSLAALQNGAWKLHQQVQQQPQHAPSTKSNPWHWPVDFFMGDGLTPLRPGQADTVCIAGMGVHTMVEILTQKTNDASQLLLLDELNCQRLILQPTNARPRHLIRLYDTLRDMGWTVKDERMEYISSRWYLSSCFVRRNHPNASGEEGHRLDRLPGALLASSATTPIEMQGQFLDWVSHNCQWIRQDLEKNGSVTHPREVLWLNEFLNLLEVVPPRQLAKQ